MTNCRVPEANRLQNANSFRDTAQVLRLTRSRRRLDGHRMSRWAPTKHALKYAQERKQFGKPIGSFQLIQDLLARMLGQRHGVPIA